MNLSEYSGLLDKLLLVTTVYIALFIFSHSFGMRKDHRLLRMLAFIVCVTGIAAGCFLIEAFKLINVDIIFILVYKNTCNILLIVSAIFSMCIISNLSRKDILFVGCASIAMSYSANYMYSFACSFFYGPSIDLEIDDTLRIFIFLIIYAMLYVACWFIFVRHYKGNEKGYAINVSGYILFILCFIINMYVEESDMDGVMMHFQYLAKFITNIIILFFLFYISKYLNLQEENIKIQYIMEKEKLMYTVSKDCVEQANIKIHDMKKIINIIKGNQKISDEFVAQLENIYNKYETLYRTGNDALDVTLNEKCRDFAENNIQSSIIVEGALLSFMSDVDIYILFSNLIDNAKEAMCKIADENNRIFNMSLKKRGETVFLHIENTFSVAPVFSGGLPLTSKDDKNNHGYGVKSIKAITEKYGGIMRMAGSNGLFSVDIAFP